MIFCQECGRPWGVQATGPEAIEGLRAAFMDQWVERWQDSADDPRWTPEPPMPDLPEPSEVKCFWITEASARWLSDYVGHEPEIGVPPCWNEYDQGSVPAWWVKGRLRPFTRWDCCNLPNDPADTAGFYEPIPA